MTQTARPQTPWLVPVGKSSDMEHETFTRICRGHVPLGKVLGYFVYEASWQAKNEGMDITHIESIPLKREQKKILAQVKISQNSLTTYIKQLVEWGYIQADTHRHTYAVCFQTINTAIADPPALFPKKPRGKHAPPKVISPESQAKKIAKLRNKLTTLGKRFSNLGKQITTLRNELSNLGITEFAESASEQGFEGNFEAPRIYRITKDILEDSLVVSASAESDGGISFLSQLRSFEDTLKEVQNGQTPLDISCSPEGYHQEEPMKPADTSIEPAPSAVHDTTNVPQEIPTPEQPTEPLFPAAQPLPGNKTHRKDNRKISVLSVPKVPPRVIREAIDAIRGYGLDQEGPIKHQGVILKEWCQKHTLEDFQHVIEHLTKGRCSNEKHQWWREKNHMKTFFNAAKLAELTPDILSELGHIPKPEAPPEVAPSVEEPKIVGWTPVRQIYPPKGVTVTYGS
jgi:hypothetical protein